MSVNIRGLGKDRKRDWIQKLWGYNDIGFMMVQETQCASLDGMDLSTFWGHGDFIFEHVDATGRSGGLISMWDPKRFVMSLVYGSIRDSGLGMAIINVYSPQKLREKRELWVEMVRVITQDDTYWMVGGDFNCVRDRGDRRNSKFNAAETDEFNDFIEGAGLHEYLLKGRKFTFVTGNKCSRIERLFVSWNFLSSWPNAEYRALARECSDHSPLILKVEYRNFGIKPFCVYNSWLYRSGFEEMVDKALLDFNDDGLPDVHLMKKFKHLRHVIAKWVDQNKTVESEEEENLIHEVNVLDSIIEQRDFSEADRWVYEEAKARIKELQAFKDK